MDSERGWSYDREGHPTKIGVLLLLRQNERISESYKEYPYVLRVCLRRSRRSETTPGPPVAQT